MRIPACQRFADIQITAVVAQSFDALGVTQIEVRADNSKAGCCAAGVFGIVLAQMRQHLGLFDSISPPGSCAPGADSSDSSGKPDAALSRTCAAGAPLTAVDVDTLMQRALRSNIAAAGRTLASLARLVKSLPTLAMPDLVGDQVRSA